MPRITTPDDLGQLNRALQRIDKLEKQLNNTRAGLAQVSKKVTVLDAVHAPSPTTNDLVLTWTGGTSTVSWPAGSVQDKNAQAIIQAPGQVHTTPIIAGARNGLAPSTYYWVGWSKTQNQMVFTTDAHPILNQQDIHMICRIFTGTGAQTGVAGGGGSQSTRDLSGLAYKNF